MAIHVYVDESSGGNVGRFFVMAAYVGSESAWAGFSVKWARLLAKFSLSMFHMVDCEHGRKEYEGLSRDDRQQMQEEFISAITSSDIHGYAVAVDLYEYEQVRPEYKKQARIPPGAAISGSVLGESTEFSVAIALNNSLPNRREVTNTYDHKMRWNFPSGVTGSRHFGH